MLLCLQANIHSLSGSTFFCPRLWMMLTLSKSRVHVWVTVPVSLSWLITAPAQNTDCINQATFLIPVYVLTIYPLLLVLSLLENLRETEIGAVMLEIFIPKIFFSNIIYQTFFLHFNQKSEKKCYWVLISIWYSWYGSTTKLILVQKEIAWLFSSADNPLRDVQIVINVCLS